MAVEDRGRWSQILLIYALSVLAAAVISEAAPLLRAIAGEFHPRSPASIGLIMSIPALVVVFSALLVGGAVDRFGDKPLLLAGTAILICGDLGVILAHALPVLLAWRIVGGMGYVCMAVASVTMTTRITHGRRRTAALALWSTVIPASFVLCFAFAALILRSGHWRAMFLAHAALTAGLLAIAAVVLPRREAQAPGPSRLTGVMTVLRSPWPYALGVSFAFNAFLQTGVIAGLAGLLGMRIGAAEAQVQPFTVLTMAFNMAGALGVGPLLNRGVRPWAVAVTSIVLCGASGGALLFAPLDLTRALVLDCLLLLGCGGLVGLWALLPLVAPSPRTLGATSGLITQITLLGVLFGPPAVFISLSRGTGGVLVFLVVALAGCFAGLPVWRRSPAPTSRAATGDVSGPTLDGSFH